MKTNDIEELFEAAKRHEKDLQRQQQLSDLVDQWAAAENKAGKEIISADETSKYQPKRRSIKITLSIAASILLLVSIGLRALLPETPSHDGTILADAKTDTTTDATPVIDDNPLEIITNSTEARPVVTKPVTEKMLLAETTDEDNPVLPETIDTIKPTPTDVPLLAENDNIQAESANVSAEKHVFERTSNRLVSSKTIQQPILRQTKEDTERQLLAYSGTGTSVQFELGKINF